MPKEQLREYVEGARRQAEEGLGRALEPFGNTINPARVHLVRGLPHIELVALASRNADLALDTSIVAVKPDGFVSPVTS
jgi:hypothetical protein